MGRTRTGPNEIELTPTGVKLNGPGRERVGQPGVFGVVAEQAEVTHGTRPNLVELEKVVFIVATPILYLANPRAL